VFKVAIIYIVCSLLSISRLDYSLLILVHISKVRIYTGFSGTYHQVDVRNDIHTHDQAGSERANQQSMKKKKKITAAICHSHCRVREEEDKKLFVYGQSKISC